MNEPFGRLADGWDVGGNQYRNYSHARSYSLPKNPPVIRGSSRKYGSCGDLFADHYSTHPKPDALVAALPGCWELEPETGLYRLRFTNLDWPSVTEAELADDLGISIVEIINDLQAAVLGTRKVSRGELMSLKTGPETPRRNVAAVTFSSGVNWTTGRRGGGLPLDRENGHVPPALPTYWRGSPIVKLTQFASLILHRSATIEDLLAGPGVRLIVEFLEAKQGRFIHPPVRDQIRQQVAEGGDLAPLMTKGAVGGDKFWSEVAYVYAEVLGHLLHQIVVTDVVGELYIQGNVVMGTPGFARWLFNAENTRLLKILSDPIKPMSFIPRDVTIWGVPEEASMAVLGAQAHAESLLGVGV